MIVKIKVFMCTRMHAWAWEGERKKVFYIKRFNHFQFYLQFGCDVLIQIRFRSFRRLSTDPFSNLEKTIRYTYPVNRSTF